jgi:glycosyltransferase involved in cell wall biosynthesis
MVFMGTLKNENGPDLAIEAMPEILAKYPKATLQIIGGEENDRKALANLAKSLKVEKNITFYGFVHDADEMSKIIRNRYLGLSLYRAIPGSPRYYGDAGKIRAYTAAGIPVITTDVPPLGREVTEKGAAIMIKDNPNDLVKAVDKIFSNNHLYLKLRKNAIQFAQGNTWENTYGNAFLEMERKYE